MVAYVNETRLEILLDAADEAGFSFCGVCPIVDVCHFDPAMTCQEKLRRYLEEDD